MTEAVCVQSTVGWDFYCNLTAKNRLSDGLCFFSFEIFKEFRFFCVWFYFVPAGFNRALAK